MKRPTEEALQGSIVTWFNNNYCLATHNPRCLIAVIPNEYTRGRKVLGVFNGFSDLIVLLPSKILFVECKLPKNNQTPSQKLFERIVTALGFKYYVVKSLEQFKSIIQDATKSIHRTDV